MKKILFFMKRYCIALSLLVGFLLIAVNLYAAGDLIVEGNAGIGTTTPTTKLDVVGNIKGTGGLWLNGAAGSTPTSGTGTRLMWIPAKAAFRAGYVGGTGTAWDDANIGQYSFAAGLNSKANGQSSSAFGSNSIASGFASFASGNGVTASGPYAAAFGDTVTVSGWQSFGGGGVVTVSGNRSFGFGQNVNVSGDGAFGLGSVDPLGGVNYVVASGNGSFAGGAYAGYDFGLDIIASGAGSFAWGYVDDYEGITASGLASMAVGRTISATADYAYAFGKNFENSTTESFAVGFGQKDFNVASGNVQIGTPLDTTLHYTQLDTLNANTAGPPPSTDCDASTEVGRSIVSTRYSATTEYRLWICTQTGASTFTWKYMVLN